MYAGRVACCPLVSHGEYADGTDRKTDARPLHDATRSQLNKRPSGPHVCQRRHVTNDVGRSVHQFATVELEVYNTVLHTVTKGPERD